MLLISHSTKSGQNSHARSCRRSVLVREADPATSAETSERGPSCVDAAESGPSAACALIRASGIRIPLQEITEAADRAYPHARRLELAPQAVHVNLDRVGADLLVPAVELLRELLFVDDAPAPHHEH